MWCGWSQISESISLKDWIYFLVRNNVLSPTYGFQGEAIRIIDGVCVVQVRFRGVCYSMLEKMEPNICSIFHIFKRILGSIDIKIMIWCMSLNCITRKVLWLVPACQLWEIDDDFWCTALEFWIGFCYLKGVFGNTCHKCFYRFWSKLVLSICFFLGQNIKQVFLLFVFLAKLQYWYLVSKRKAEANKMWFREARSLASLGAKVEKCYPMWYPISCFSLFSCKFFRQTIHNLAFNRIFLSHLSVFMIRPYLNLFSCTFILIQIHSNKSTPNIPPSLIITSDLTKHFTYIKVLF